LVNPAARKISRSLGSKSDIPMQVRGTARQDGLRSSGTDVQVQFGWYRQAKLGTHDGTTLGLCGHKIAMEDGSNATPEVLMKALEAWNTDVRLQAAGHRNATAEVLMKALEDGYDGVRVAAASNRNATTEVLMKASKDDSTTVRWTAACHRNATAGIKAEWVINALKSRSRSEIFAFFQDLEFNRGEFIMSDLIRLIITDKRVDLGGLDMFQEAVQDYKFDNPIVSRMIKREKMWRKTDA